MQTPNHTSIDDEIGSCFEGKTISTLVTNAKETFFGYRYGKADDYQPEDPLVIPDCNALDWIYKKRLADLDVKYSFDIYTEYYDNTRYTL